MNRLSGLYSLSLLLAAVPAFATNPTFPEIRFQDGISPGELTPTPEMWFYQQYRLDYADPELAVRKRAEFRAKQRQHRLSAMKWFGLSNQRPQASSDPFHGTWSPVWRSNNTFYPFQWNGVGRPSVYLWSTSSGTWPW